MYYIMMFYAETLRLFTPQCYHMSKVIVLAHAAET